MDWRTAKPSSNVPQHMYMVYRQAEGTWAWMGYKMDQYGPGTEGLDMRKYHIAWEMAIQQLGYTNEAEARAAAEEWLQAISS